MRTTHAPTFLRSPLVVSALALFTSLAACSSAPTSGEGAERAGEAIASSSGGGGGLGEGNPWGCQVSGDTCLCTGDVDCNDMFSSGVCSGKAFCQINSQDIPKCVCVMADVVKPVSPVTPIRGVGHSPPLSTH